MKSEGGEGAAEASTGDLTVLLRAWQDGDEQARSRLLDRVYVELKRIAGSQMRHERRDQTLEVTGLVHEAFLRLAGQNRVEWRDRVHFFGLASTCMRRVLVDRARARSAAKRDPEQFLLPERPERATTPEELLDLDRALSRLEVEHSRLARVVELRYFGGLELAEIAAILELSERTIKRDWAFARAWLLEELSASK